MSNCPTPTAPPLLEAMIAAYNARSIDIIDSDPKQTTDTSSPATNWKQPPHPYPGLRSFRPNESSFFFGRGKSISEIHKKLKERRVVVVLGGSGSGKSSVVRAGLMPGLTSTESIEGRTGRWYAVDFRPRQAPMNELANALAKLVRTEFPTQSCEVPDGGVAASCVSSAAAVDEDQIRKRLLSSFDSEGLLVSPVRREARAAALRDALISFVDIELDRRDDIAEEGIRSGPANLLLVIDQFEEVFRPGVPGDKAGGRRDLLDLVISLYTWLSPDNEAARKSGLFLVLTMRSEELHRCTEHPGLSLAGVSHTLSDVVNGSSYLLDLLDPEYDQQDLCSAIVTPARKVFRSWELPLAASDEHAPFGQGVVEWLLAGAAQLSRGLSHRPDQLPLLQHALQAMWQEAILEWERALSSNSPLDLTIRREHLKPAVTSDTDSKSADLKACLDARANRAADEAAELFECGANKPNLGSRVPSGAGQAAIRAGFRALARRDDRGNWARRFADLEEMLEFLNADPETGGAANEDRKPILAKSLQAFIARDYVSLGKTGAYDLSHEALIRNWERYLLWLHEPEDVAEALVEAVDGVVRSSTAERQKPDRLISVGLAERLAPIVGDRRTLPVDWAVTQIEWMFERAPVLNKLQPLAPASDRPTLARKVLNEIAEIRDGAEKARRRQDEEHLRLVARAAIAEANKNRALKVLGAAGFVAIAMALVAAWGFHQERRANSLANKFQMAAHDAHVAELNAEEAGKIAVGEVALGGLAGENSFYIPRSRRAYELKYDKEYFANLGNYETLNRDTVLQSTMASWDSDARATLGRSYADSNLLPAHVPISEPICMSIDTNGKDGATDTTRRKSETQAALPFGGGNIRVFFAASKDSPTTTQLRVKDGRDEYDSGLPPWLFPPGSRTCLGSDGGLLVIAMKGTLPFLFELIWTKSNKLQWQAEPAPVLEPRSTGPVQQTTVTENQIACVVSVTGEIDNLEKDGKRSVYYAIEDDSTSPDPCGNVRTPSRVAEYSTGVGWPIEIGGKSSPLLKEDECMPTDPKKADEMRWACRDGEVTIRVLNGDGHRPVITARGRGPNGEFWTDKITLYDENVMPPKGIKKIALSKRGDVLLWTEDQLIWRLVASDTALDRLLSQADKDGEKVMASPHFFDLAQPKKKQ